MGERGDLVIGGLEAAFTARRGSFSLDLELAVSPGRVAALVGPNGAGKSTALRSIAGLLGTTSGRITLDGRVLDDAATGVRVPSAARGVGVVFQDYLLFPHLSAIENVAFGPLAHGTGRRVALERSRGWLERLGIGGLADRRPRDLSGGQAQRVALARALVLEPSLLLLDEPLAALDASSRLTVRADLAQQLRSYGGATVLVTHDPVDALALADELVVLERGSVAQRGHPSEVARAPVNDYVAHLMGMNLLSRDGHTPFVFAPGAVTVSAENPGAVESATVLECRVVGMEEVAGRVRMLLSTVAGGERIAADLDTRSFVDGRLDRSQRVWATVKPYKS